MLVKAEDRLLCANLVSVCFLDTVSPPPLLSPAILREARFSEWLPSSARVQMSRSSSSCSESRLGKAEACPVFNTWLIQLFMEESSDFLVVSWRML